MKKLTNRLAALLVAAMAAGGSFGMWAMEIHSQGGRK